MFTKIKQAIRHYIQSRKASEEKSSAETMLYGILLVLVGIGPLFFIPIRAFSITSSKGVFIVALGLVAALTYTVHVLKQGALTLPRQKIFLIAGLLVVSVVIGSIFGTGISGGFIGYGFEITSGLFISIFALMMFLAYRVLHTYERIGMIYGAVLGASVILIIIQILRFIGGPAFMNMGVLGNATATLIGSWSDLAILLGFIILSTMVTLELAGLTSLFKNIVRVIGMSALIALLVMNNVVVWVVVGLVSLITALYLFAFAYWDHQAHSYKKTERVPGYALTVFLVALLAIFFGGFINGIASRYQNISVNDVRPSWNMTFKVAQKSLVHNFATGYGPNSFGDTWLRVKPTVLSGGDTARTLFSQGVGTIPTYIATQGIIGALLWVLFFGVLIYAGIQKIKKGFSGSLDRYFSIVLGVSVIYLSILAWVYLPGAYWLIVLAICIGAFLKITQGSTSHAEHTISFIKDPRTSFFGILGVLLLGVTLLTVGYIHIRKTVSLGYFTQGMMRLTQGDRVGGENKILQAIVFARHDGYYQRLALLGLSNAADLISQTTAENRTTRSKQVEQVLGTSLAYAQAATVARPGNYQNWVTLGDVYSFMVSVGVSDAYDRAIAAYEQAVTLNPNDSTMVLYFAKLALAQKNTEQALVLIKKSIDMYPTRDAYIMQAQIRIAQNNITAAGESLRNAVGVDPYNADLTYQYALLVMSQKQYREALTLFQRVIMLNNQYAPAYVYLGYVYEQLGDTENAQQVYTFVRNQFPGGAAALDAIKKGSIEQPDPQVGDTPSDPSSPDTSIVAPTAKR